MIVSVFGSAHPLEGSPEYQQGYLLGQLLAEAGYTVMTGGYRGVMEAAARGASEAGAKTIGVTCADIDVWRPGGPNQWISEHHSTPHLNARLEVLTRKADAYIALPGGIGTLGEIILALNLIAINSIHARPLIAVGSGWYETFNAFYEACEPHIAAKDKQFLLFAPDVQAAIEILKNTSSLET